MLDNATPAGQYVVGYLCAGVGGYGCGLSMCVLMYVCLCDRSVISGHLYLWAYVYVPMYLGLGYLSMSMRMCVGGWV